MTKKRHVVVYTRHDCHLCDDACQVLRRNGCEPTLIDVDQEPHLQEKYGDWVPVVVIDGQERFKGHVSEVLLRRLL